jgi:hypothetical protein
MSFNFQIARSGSSGFVCVWPSDLALGTYWRVILQMATRHTLLFAASRVLPRLLCPRLRSRTAYRLPSDLTSETRPAASPPPRLRDENCLELTFSQRCSLHGDHA